MCKPGQHLECTCEPGLVELWAISTACYTAASHCYIFIQKESGAGVLLKICCGIMEMIKVDEEECSKSKLYLKEDKSLGSGEMHPRSVRDVNGDQAGGLPNVQN